MHKAADSLLHNTTCSTQRLAKFQDHDIRSSFEIIDKNFQLHNSGMGDR